MLTRYLVIVAFHVSLSVPKCAGFNLKSDNEKANDASDSTSTADLSGDTSDEDNVHDRFNLNFNVAQAQGIGRFGGQSQSNSMSYGINAGIRNAHGQYQNLFSKTASQSHGFSSGPGAPLTFANTASRVRPGHVGGNAASGLLGGKGTAFAKSQNQNIAIPLDNRGTVLLSNLMVPEENASQPVHAPLDEDEDYNMTTSKDSNKSPIVFV